MSWAGLNVFLERDLKFVDPEFVGGASSGERGTITEVPSLRAKILRISGTHIPSLAQILLARMMKLLSPLGNFFAFGSTETCW